MRVEAFVSLLFICGCASPKSPTTEGGPVVDGFFKAAPDRAADFPTDELYPRGRLMMCSLCSVISPELEKMKQDGFTAIGPYYGDQSRSKVIEKAKTSGLKCIYAVGKRINFVKDPKYVMPSDDELRDYITQQVKEVAEYSGDRHMVPGQ